MSVYKYILEDDLFIQTNIFGRNFVNNWICFDELGMIRIKKGYAWDGCSPKFKAFDLLIGTPDGKTIKHENGKHRAITYYASCLHDVIYQFKNEIPISRKEGDSLFLTQLNKVEFALTKVYLFFVRAFGWIYGNWDKK